VQFFQGVIFGGVNELERSAYRHMELKISWRWVRKMLHVYTTRDNSKLRINMVNTPAEKDV
jgi:hypothetical protein